jgi:fructose-1,6-bisphosphatase/inositol monophosphatase family enzyme
MRADGLVTERKTSITDLVSAADRSAEALIAERLRAARPGDGILGEEGTADEPAEWRVNPPSGEEYLATRPEKSPLGEDVGACRGGGAGARTWVVDPVDGTYNFLAGLPIWCSALALAPGGRPEAGEPDAEPLLGAVYQPATDELWLGGPGRPTTRNGDAVRPVRPDRGLAQLSLAAYLHPPRLAEDGPRAAWLRALGGAATIRTLGSASVELAAVASGRLGAWLQLDCPPWDWLPGSALVRAAGGATAVLDAHGHRWHAAGPARAVAELTALVRG